MNFNADAVMKAIRTNTALAVEQEVERVAAEARRLAPVGTVTKGTRKTFFARRSRKAADGSRVRYRVRVVAKTETSWTARNPGTLRDSIYTKVRWKNGVCLGFVKAGFDRKRGEGDPNAFYAPFVEYGTKKMAARPFMRPAGAKARTENIAAAMRGALN
jgi:HK97 gp10 family phage protein